MFNLATSLFQRGVETDVLTCNTEDAPSEETFAFGRIFRLDAWNFLNGMYPIPKFTMRNFATIRNLKHRKYDVYHTHTRFYLLTFLMSLLARWRRIPQVHTEHGSSSPQLSQLYQSFIARTFDQILGRFPFRCARKVTAVSHAAEVFSQSLGAKHVRIIPVGAQQLQGVKFLPRESLGYSANDLILVFAGRLIEAKGVQDILAILPRLQYPCLVFCIIGDGPYRKTLEQLPQAHCEVQFMGVLEHQQVLQYLAIADIVVNPSYTEGMPTTVLEAAVLGRAIVATDVGGTREILQSTNEGRLYPPGNLEQLTSHLNHLLREPSLRKQLGEQAQRRVRSFPTWDEIATDFISTYETAVAS